MKTKLTFSLLTQKGWKCRKCRKCGRQQGRATISSWHPQLTHVRGRTSMIHRSSQLGLIQTKFNFFIWLVNLWMSCLHECLCSTCAWCQQWPEEGMGCPGIEVKTVTSRAVGAENWTLVLWRAVGALNRWAPAPAPNWSSDETKLTFSSLTRKASIWASSASICASSCISLSLPFWKSFWDSRRLRAKPSFSSGTWKILHKCCPCCEIVIVTISMRSISEWNSVQTNGF